MKKKLFFFGIPILIVAALIGYSVMTRLLASKKEPESEHSGIPVIVEKPETGVMERILSLSGNLHPVNTVTVLSRVPGRVERIFTREGNQVSKDQLIGQIGDNTQTLQMEQAHAAWEAAQAQHEKAKKGVRSEELENVRALTSQAEEDLETAKDTFERSQKLYSAGAIAKTQYEETESLYRSALTALENARRNIQMMEKGAGPEEQRIASANAAAMEARYKLARLNWSFARIESPVSGSVARVLVDEGNLVGQTNPIIVIIQDDPLVARVPVPEKYYGSIRALQHTLQARISPIAYPDLDPFVGTLSALGAVIDAMSRTFTVEVEIDNPGGMLRPGMFVNVDLVLDRFEDALSVPIGALVNRNGREGLFVVDPQSRAQFQEVERGIVQDNRVQVLAGVSTADSVVVDGNAFLETGQKLRMVKPQ